MNYPEYRADLQRIHESEIYGAAVFNAAASITFNQDKKKKWLCLKNLEERTLNRYLTYMKETGKVVTNPVGWDLKGAAEGAVLGILPWSMAMQQLANGTIPFQEKFLRLKENAVEKQDIEFFSYIYQHEKAIESFAFAELAGEQNSLKIINDLLL